MQGQAKGVLEVSRRHNGGGVEEKRICGTREGAEMGSSWKEVRSMVGPQSLKCETIYV